MSTEYVLFVLLATIPSLAPLIAGVVILKNRRSKESPVVWAIGVLAITFGVGFGCYMSIILLMSMGQFFW